MWFQLSCKLEASLGAFRGHHNREAGFPFFSLSLSEECIDARIVAKPSLATVCPFYLYVQGPSHSTLSPALVLHATQMVICRARQTFRLSMLIESEPGPLVLLRHSFPRLHNTGGLTRPVFLVMPGSSKSPTALVVAAFSRHAMWLRKAMGKMHHCLVEPLIRDHECVHSLDHWKDKPSPLLAAFAKGIISKCCMLTQSLKRKKKISMFKYC